MWASLKCNLSKYIKILGIYLMISLFVLGTLEVANTNSVVLPFLLVAIVIITGGMRYLYTEIRYAAKEKDWQKMQYLEKEVHLDAWVIGGSLLLYGLALSFPILASNNITLSIFKLILWICNIPIIGWLVGIGGILYVTSAIIYGLTTVRFLFRVMVMRKRTQEPPMEPDGYTGACFACRKEFNTLEPLTFCPNCSKPITHVYKQFFLPNQSAWIYSHQCDKCKIRFSNIDEESTCFQCGNKTECISSTHYTRMRSRPRVSMISYFKDLL
jgi:hypothetical protein